MYFDRHNMRRQRSSSSVCRCDLPPARMGWYMFMTLFVIIILLYLSIMISRSWCDHEKEIIQGQCNRQLEMELTKLRQCIEDKASKQEKVNDLQWEIEKFKRTNNELQSDNEKLNSAVKELTSKIEAHLQQIQNLKINIEELKLKHENIKQNMVIHQQQQQPKHVVQLQPIIEQENPSEKHIETHSTTLSEQDRDLIDDKSPFQRNAVSIKSSKVGIAVVIFCYNRASYLERTLESIFRSLPPAEFSVFISQQGYDESVTNIIRKYSVDSGRAYWLGFDYEITDKKIKRGFEEQRWRVYHKISAHYKFAFDYIFDKLNYDKVISLEDDMEISPDFFSYFHSIGALMDNDKSIFCVSAWNDYGQKQLVSDTTALYRTDIFPGLGWMITRDIWNELKVDWPLAFWDDWLRVKKQRNSRSCIRPEINRVFTFGSTGSSEGLFWSKYLRTILLNTDDIDWTKQDVNYILNSNYDSYIKQIIEDSTVIDIQDVVNLETKPMPLDYVVKYSHLEDYTVKSKKLNLMEDHKDGLPRQSYRGIVIVRWNSHRILFVPDNIDWTERTF